MEPSVREPTKSERLAVTIRDAIRNGTLLPGVLYSAHELGEKFGASRTPVREALLKLADAGLVRIERNRGARVLRSTNRDICEVFTLRMLLEPAAASRAATQAEPPVAALDATLAQMRAHQSDRDAFFAADGAFHDILLRAGGNERLADYVASLRDVISLQDRRTVPSTRGPEHILAEHKAIADAVRAGDRELAARAMHEHLINTADLLIDDAEWHAELWEWAGLGGPGGAMPSGGHASRSGTGAELDVSD